MNNQPQNLGPDAQLMNLRIFTAAMAMSISTLGFVLFATQKWNLNQAEFQALLSDIQVQALFGMGVILLVLRTPVANHLLKLALQGKDIQDKSLLLQLMFPSQILRLALAEASALFGFVIAFLHGESTSFLILGLAALFAMAREWPSFESLKWRAELLQSSSRRGRT
ncbi:MAG: hypothetical protein ACK5V3_09985 [Bdellovibrionales bacterium]